MIQTGSNQPSRLGGTERSWIEGGWSPRERHRRRAAGREGLTEGGAWRWERTSVCESEAMCSPSSACGPFLLGDGEGCGVRASRGYTPLARDLPFCRSSTGNTAGVSKSLLGRGVPIVPQQVTNLASIHEDAGLIPGLTQG